VGATKGRRAEGFVIAFVPTRTERRISGAGLSGMDGRMSGQVCKRRAPGREGAHAYADVIIIRSISKNILAENY
jgi:hypothetical protein